MLAQAICDLLYQISYCWPSFPMSIDAAMLATLTQVDNSTLQERVYRALNERAGQVIAQGYSVIIDAAFLREFERDKLSMEAARLGADFLPIFLTAELDVRLSRVASRRHDASDATGEVARGQEDDDVGGLDWPLVDASGSPRQTLERSTALLAPVRISLREDTE